MYASEGFCYIVRLPSGGSRNIERGFPMAVDPRRGGLGVQPPAAEDVLVFISI